MVAPNQDVKEMDLAADEARKELTKHIKGWSALELAAWWKNWYRKAGHKRLGRMLVDLD